MFDAQRLLDQFLGTGRAGAPSSPPAPQAGHPPPAAPPQAGAPPPGSGLPPWAGVAGGALAGGLAGVLLGSKKGRKVAGKVATYGGLAAIGGLAYKAYRDWQANRPPDTGATPTQAPHPPGPSQAPGPSPDPDAPGWTPPPADSPFLPAPERADAAQDLGRVLLQAMIMATKADGHIDADEYRRIFEHLNTLDLEPDAKAFVMDELNRPMDVRALTAAVTGPEVAAEIYAASLLAIDPDGPAERGYLAMLAAQLRLDPALVEHLHASVAASTA
ncbi:tellurite resistance TerB family protein [Roseospira goensis]|uniref:Uncharacterized membrane protein YebE (DUF533 family) n=1 Tax=Roseospira goensis TaxID=391922 RepID=A0A7W6S1D5_9PROT|nr:tellurite resistance TerB family protein [Roseospira goensis]MBB4287121.1 uncharacterized membrane protein YebE (DUF533 family) [Roseospira goensis]